jgi:hypothetical protein
MEFKIYLEIQLCFPLSKLNTTKNKHVNLTCIYQTMKKVVVSLSLGKPHPKLQDRVGDFVLIMKEGYVLKDALMDDVVDFCEGYHGGVSKEEMWVPLSIIRMK